MDRAGIANSLWDLLTKDISLWGGFQSPVLSWLGSFAILLFALWHAGRLMRAVSGMLLAYGRIRPALTKLFHARGRADQEWLLIGAEARKKAQEAALRPERIDLDDVQALDSLLRGEPLLTQAWLKFRKTYVVEQASWFVEPRVCSTRSASEFFSLDALFASRLNLTFYHQFPSLLTGFGLLFTFLAILIGLSKIHADGSQIVGIQGLINGLAGKFLSSIVGLVCANGFVLFEKSLVFRLTGVHEQCLIMLDELFPRKTVEQILEHGAAAPVARGGMVVNGMGSETAERVGRMVMDRMAPSLQALTTAIHKLARQGMEQPSGAGQNVAAEVSRGIQNGLAGPMQELTRTLQELGQRVDPRNASQARTEEELDDLAGRLTIDLSHLGDDLHDKHAGGLLPELKRLVTRRQKPVGAVSA